MKLNRYIVDVVREPVDLELLSSKIAQDIGTSMSAVNLWSLLPFLFNASSTSSLFSGYFSSKRVYPTIACVGVLISWLAILINSYPSCRELNCSFVKVICSHLLLRRISELYFNIFKNRSLSSSDFRLSANPFQDSISSATMSSSGNRLIC